MPDTPPTQLPGQTIVPVEASLRAASSHPDIFNDVTVDVVVTSSEGETWRVPAFWAGGDAFRFRFAAPEPGVYQWESQCSSPEDQGLHGQAGEIEIVPYQGDCVLYHRGRPRVAESRRTLAYGDGTPLLWLADTWWFGLTQRLDWPEGFQCLAADRIEKGFSVIQLVAGPPSEFDATTNAFDPQVGNDGGLPWEPGYARINPGYYDHADLRVRWLIEQGLLPCIVGMWGFHLAYMGVEKAKQHWRNLVARYGSYPVVWCMAGEACMPTYSIGAKGPESNEYQEEKRMLKRGWTEVTRYVRELDPFRNLITVHSSDVPGGSRGMIEDESLLDYNMLQTGHSGYLSLEPSVAALVQEAAREPVMPTLIGEACYEGILGGSREEVQRFLFWTSMLSGACGFSYGAQGIWGMNTREAPLRGYTASWGDATWREAMHLPGSAQLAIGRRFMDRYPWRLFRVRREPAAEKAGRFSVFAAGIPGKVALFYLPVGCLNEELWGLQKSFFGDLFEIAIEPDARYEAHYFNPRNGEETRESWSFGATCYELGEVVPDENGFWAPPPKPSREDWVLVLEDEKALAGLSDG